MSKQIRAFSVLLSVLFMGSMLIGVNGVMAADVKIGVINMQKVLAGSDAGKKAQAVVAKKMESLQADFQKDEKVLIALQQEIEKKSSAWSDEMKREKGTKFQQLRRDLAVKQEEANLELKTLREDNVGPILKKLQGVVKEVAKDKGFTLVLPHNVILYASDNADLTESVTKALNKAMK